MISAVFILSLLAIIGTAFARNATISTTAGMTCTLDADNKPTCKRSVQFDKYVKSLLDDLRKKFPSKPLSLPAPKRVVGSSDVCAAVMPYFTTAER